MCSPNKCAIYFIFGSPITMKTFSGGLKLWDSIFNFKEQMRCRSCFTSATYWSAAKNPSTIMWIRFIESAPSFSSSCSRYRCSPSSLPANPSNVLHRPTSLMRSHATLILTVGRCPLSTTRRRRGRPPRPPLQPAGKRRSFFPPLSIPHTYISFMSRALCEYIQPSSTPSISME